MGGIEVYLGNIISTYHLPKITITNIVEIFILTVIFYYIIKSLKGTRGWIIAKGMMAVALFYAIAYAFRFTVIVILFQNILLFLGMAVVIIIQPEIRKMIENLGRKNINITLKKLAQLVFKDKSKNITVEKRISDFTIQELVKGCFSMAKVKTGALIVIQGDIPLNDYIDSGIRLNANITSQLIINIFEKNTPLHDGAVIITDDKITAATCYLPLSDNKNINKSLGTRHRAGIGMSEATDASVIIVSEETGAVSFVVGGKIYTNLDRESLLEKLKSIQVKSVDKIEIHKESFINDKTGLKIICFALTICLWAVITLATNPITTTTFKNVPIQVINSDAVIDKGKTFDIVGNEFVNVTVKDRKDIIDRIQPGDVKVVADLSKLSIVNSVPLEVVMVNYPDSETALSESTLTVEIEDITTTEVNVEIEKTGKANTKYYIADITLDSDTLVISGGKSVINTIDRVVVRVDESKLTTDTVLDIAPIIYDKNGEEISKDRLSLSVDKIKADITLFNTKTVPLNITPVVGNKVISDLIESIEYNEKSIVVTGPDEVLDECTSVNISIPLNIAVTDIMNYEYIRNINIQDFLVDGLMVTNQYSKINLTVKFNNFYYKTIEFNSSDIAIEGQTDEKRANIQPKDFKVNIVSIKQSLSDIDISDMQPYIDITDLQSGAYLQQVKFKNNSFNVIGNIDINLEISE